MLVRRSVQVSIVFTVLGLVTTVVWACGGYGHAEQRTSSEIVLRLAEISKERNCYARFSDEMTELVAELRRYGQPGLDLMIQHRSLLVSDLGEQADPIDRYEELIDRVAAQRFATQSKLYWHTSLDDARRESRERQVPIINLRLLGRLDEDLSCANSRFFRTTLYPNQEIAKRMREQFVLLWQPVRKVPVATIDFGDGRKLRQPITGNSVHLVLDSQGRPIDALPGLVSTDAFINWIDEVSTFWNESERASESVFWNQVADYHRKRAELRRTTSEMATRADQSVAQLNPLDPRWDQLAVQTTRARLVPASLALLNEQLPDGKNPFAEVAMPIAASKMPVELPMLRMVQAIEPHIARDTVFNLYGLQPKIDDWFAAVSVPINMDDLTQRLYKDVFLMPLDDPWLGLSPSDSFAALHNGGRIESNLRED